MDVFEREYFVLLGQIQKVNLVHFHREFKGKLHEFAPKRCWKLILHFQGQLKLNWK